MGQVDFYKIPEGLPCAIQFSGGRTSGYMLHEILKANDGLPKHTHVLFQNTGREMEETLRFVADISSNFNVQITWLEFNIVDGKETFDVVSHNSASRNGEPFEKLLAKRKSLPNAVSKYCSDVLKYRTAKRYMVSLGYKKYRACVGLRYDEPDRVAKIHARKHARQVIWTPLFDAKATKETVKAFWDNASFDLDLENVRGNTPLGNCDGCFLKSEKNHANLCRHYPEKAAWWAEQEAKKLANGTGKTGSRFKLGYTWKALAEVVERSPLMALEDDNIMFFCDSTNGSCEGY